MQYDLYKVFTKDSLRATVYVASNEDPDFEIRRWLGQQNVAPANVSSISPAGYRTEDVRPKNTPFVAS